MAAAAAVSRTLNWPLRPTDGCCDGGRRRPESRSSAAADCIPCAGLRCWRTRCGHDRDGRPRRGRLWWPQSREVVTLCSRRLLLLLRKPRPRPCGWRRRPSPPCSPCHILCRVAVSVTTIILCRTDNIILFWYRCRYVTRAFECYVAAGSACR